MNSETAIVAVLAAWNLIVFLIYGLDKYKAVKGRYRISEKCLIMCAFFFGAFGAFCGMMIFRHKTKHLKFQILVPLLLVLNCAAIYILMHGMKIF